MIPNQPPDVINIMCGYVHIFSHTDKSCYEGAVNTEGKKHGSGTEIWLNGCWRQGLYVNDAFHGGRGKLVVGGEVKDCVWHEFKCTGTFEGKWNMHEMTCTGKICYVSGGTYEGGLLQAETGLFRHGFGVQRNPTGYVYEGEYDHGKCHGQGKLTVRDGCVYQGQFVHDLCEGQGTLTCLDGRMLQGVFKGHQLVQGKHIYANGDVYDGAFAPPSEEVKFVIENLPRHGFGTFVDKATGTRYEGLFFDALSPPPSLEKMLRVLMGMRRGRAWMFVFSRIYPSRFFF